MTNASLQCNLASAMSLLDTAHTTSYSSSVYVSILYRFRDIDNNLPKVANFPVLRVNATEMSTRSLASENWSPYDYHAQGLVCMTLTTCLAIFVEHRLVTYRCETYRQTQSHSIY